MKIIEHEKTEYALEILLSNPFLDEILLKRVEHIIKCSVDWYKVFQLSVLDRTTLIICKNLLKYHFFWIVPNQLRLIWYSAYLGNIKRNESLLSYYSSIKQEFSLKSVIAIPYRGIMLLNTIYKDLGIRMLQDIDFLTKEEYLPKIEDILCNANYKKIYIDDEDVLKCNTYQPGNEVLYCKYEKFFYINIDFCSGIKNNQELFSFLIFCLKKENSADFILGHLVTLYLSVLKTWDGNYISHNIKHFTYSTLIDLYLFKKIYVDYNIINRLNKIAINFHINDNILDVDAALNFYCMGGYLI